MIPTPNGWTTVAGLRPGDFVFGMDGRPTQVLAVSDVFTGRECWRLHFDDGSRIVADAEHLWLTYNASELNALTRRNPAWREARRKRRPSRVGGRKSSRFTASIVARNRNNPPPPRPAPAGSLRTTAEIAATLKAGRRANHAIPLAACLDLPDAGLPIDPYVLGAWLGDGTATNANLSGADEEIIDFVRLAGWPVARCGGTSRYGWRIGTPVRAVMSDGRRGLVNPFFTALQRLGVLGNKHVPPAYLRASRAQRLALLQGLMDTDGTVAKRSGSAVFVNTNRRLAEAVVELACSLGHKAHAREGRARLNGRDCGPCWQVKWTPPDIVFRLSRKVRLQKPGTRRTGRFRYIVACERIDGVPVQCIKVAAADGMFLAGPTMIPTHNSSALLMAAAQYVDVPGYAALLLRESFPDLNQPDALIPRSKGWWHGKIPYHEQTRRWTFPSGATITFGYLEADNDVYQYQGAAYQFVGIDELTQHSEFRYTYLSSRIRKPSGGPLAAVPLRLRSAANPGGKGHEFVKKRFLPDQYLKAPEGERFSRPWYKDGRFFIPARLEDNPSLDLATYERGMALLDPITRAQLRHGDWAAYQGGRFRREWLNRRYKVQALEFGQGGEYRLGERVYRADQCWRFGTADPAASSTDTAKKSDPDYTVVSAWAVTPAYDLIWLDCLRFRAEVPDIVPAILPFYRRHRLSYIAVEAVAANRAVYQIARRTAMVVKEVSPHGLDKLVRAGAGMNLAADGRLWLPEEAHWLDEVESELLRFTGNPKADAHDDVVDCLSYAAAALSELSCPDPGEPMVLTTRAR